MTKSEYKRPPGIEGLQADDPEARYRAGYQHGAAEALRAVRAIRGTHPSDAKFTAWTDAQLQTWRHDRKASYQPPKPPSS